MKEIKLTQGMVALVDDEDFDYLNQWKWYAIKTGRTFYAVRHDNVNNKHIFMHRVILNTPDNMEVDHINHDGLDCQKFNIRNCTHAQNGKNRTAYGKSGYLGVKERRTGITAAIRINGKQIYLGSFKTLEEAARAYDLAAIKHHGRFANINFR